jgi:hypothetical protein
MLPHLHNQANCAADAIKSTLVVLQHQQLKALPHQLLE